MKMATSGIQLDCAGWLFRAVLSAVPMVVLGVCLAAPPVEFRNANSQVAYAGSKACLPCHPVIYNNYSKTGMGRSITKPDASLLAAGPLTLQSGPLEFQVLAQGGELFQVESQKQDGATVWETRHKLEYAIGSGENGISFAVRRGNHLMQAPVSYYSSAKTWALSPGFEQTGAGFNRPIFEECIVCHAGRPQAVPHRDGLYREIPFAEAAIGCENCHGPGSLHITERSAAKKLALPDTSIVNPGRLPARVAEEICMQCHQGGDVRVLLPGRKYGDFRPGTRLIDTMAIVALADRGKDADLLEHHESMQLSACFRGSKGKLGCLTCHNPHEQPTAAAAPVYFRKACMSCHTQQSCKLDLAARRATGPVSDNCIACHMQKRGVERISHSALTNHRIPVRQGSPAVASPGAGAWKGLRVVNAVDGVQLPLPTRLAAYGELLPQAPAALGPIYSALLEEASRTAPQDPVVLAALAHKAALENATEAPALLRKAIDKGAPGAILHLDLAQALEKTGRLDDSVASLEQAGALFRYSLEIRKRLVLGYIRQKSYAKAASAMEKYVNDFPEDDFMRGLLRQIPRGAR